MGKYYLLFTPTEAIHKAAKLVDSKPTEKVSQVNPIVQERPVQPTAIVTPSRESQTIHDVEAKLETIGIDSSVIHKKNR